MGKMKFRILNLEFFIIFLPWDLKTAEQYSYEDSKKKNVVEILKTADVAIYRGKKIIKQLILPKQDIAKVERKISEVSEMAQTEKIQGNQENFDNLRSLIIELNDLSDYLKEVYSVTEGL